MENIYITGHKNPDMDSICSAFAYARLKNKIDPDNNYKAIRCGRINPQTKEVFKRVGIAPPPLVKDLHPKVGDIVSCNYMSLQEDEPIISAMKIIKEHNKSIIPIFSKKNNFAGMVSINEISDFFLTEDIDERPSYTFNINNFEKVLPGYFHLKGNEEEFKAAIIVGAATFDNCTRWINALGKKPVLITGYKQDVIKYAIEKKLPAIIITGLENRSEIDVNLTGYSGSIFISKKDTAESTRLLRLSTSVKGIMYSNYPETRDSDFFDDIKKQLVSSELRGLPVFNKEGFTGTVTRRCFIERPCKKVIMVDHNEAAQSVNGIENCEIVEILDHHRLGAEKTRNPIYIAAIPVGSTCTIVYQHYLQYGITPDKVEAELLLSGILSDTVILKSPTATLSDIKAVEALCNITGVDWKTYGESLFNNTRIKDADPVKMITTDFKTYNESGYRVGIGQIEVVSLQNILEMKDKLLTALEEVSAREKLDWTMVLLTNVININSVLLTTEFTRGESLLIYEKRNKNEFFLPGILSRKKQLLPEVLRVLEEI